MVRDFGIAPDETQIGYFVGLLTACSAMAQLGASMPWGMLSDRIGRKPVLLSGLASTIIGLVLFGLSRSFAWALAVKIVFGLLDGNMGVLKSMIAELTTQHTEGQRARAFSLLQIVYGLGGIVGSALGGFLSNPVQKYPSVFGHGGPITDFLSEYPYFLPCWVTAVLAALSWLTTFLFLAETLYSEDRRRSVAPSEEVARLLAEGPAESYQTIELPGPSSKFAGVRDTLTRRVLFMCVLYGLVAFQNMYYDELLPIWSASQQGDGGLGLDAKEIGTALSFAGVITLLVQLFLFHRLTQRVGTLRLFCSMLFLSIIVFFLHGFIVQLYNVPDLHGHIQTKFWVWPGLLLGLAAKTLCQTVLVTSAIILINNAAPRPDTLGTINGFSVCTSSAMRALGPAICGLVWSSALTLDGIPPAIRAHISWVVLAGMSALTFAVSMCDHPSDDNHSTHGEASEHDTR